MIADFLSRKDANTSDKDFESEINKSEIYSITNIEYSTFEYINKVELVQNPKVSEERLESIKNETNKDATLQKLSNVIANGWPNHIREVPDELKIYHKYKNELAVQNGLIFRNYRILIPYSLRKILTEKVHTSHNGIESTIRLAKQNIFWPSMSDQIKEKVPVCSVCAKYAAAQQKLPMMSQDC